jgi:hypothetical protein
MVKEFDVITIEYVFLQSSVSRSHCFNASMDGLGLGMQRSEDQWPISFWQMAQLALLKPMNYDPNCQGSQSDGTEKTPGFFMMRGDAAGKLEVLL